MRRWQKPGFLHENATCCSLLHDSHLALRNPWAKIPHLRYSLNSFPTKPGSGRAADIEIKANTADYCVQKISNFPDLGGTMVSILGYNAKEKLTFIASGASLYPYEDFVIERYTEISFHGANWSRN